MIIKFINTREDYEKGSQFFIKRLLRGQIIGVGIFSIMIVCIYCIYEEQNRLAFLAAVFAMNILGVFLYKKGNKNMLDREWNEVFKLRPSMLGEKYIELKNDTIVASNETEKSEYKINAIPKIVDKDDRIFILTKKMKPFIIIPYNAFDNISDKKEFLNYINKNT